MGIGLGSWVVALASASASWVVASASASWVVASASASWVVASASASWVVASASASASWGCGLVTSLYNTRPTSARSIYYINESIRLYQRRREVLYMDLLTGKCRN